jgi:Domain of unknown function (DUF6647)
MRHAIAGAITTASILILMAFPAHADVCPVPDTVIEEMFAWIAAHTDYDTAPTSENLPAIETCASGAAVDYGNENIIVDEGIRGLYDFDARRIYLVEPWDPDNLAHRAVLLHELVHAVQLDNRDWECIGAPEWEAYKLHEAWLVEHGLEGNFDWLQVYFTSRCPRDIHP